jgi:glycerol-3-phosphate cytidylyltransferase-like family protein
MTRRRKDRIIVTTGTFDPLTPEELSFLKKCRARGDLLVVGIHSDLWLTYSQGGFFHNFESRREILLSLRCVDEVFTFNDGDGTVCQLLKLVKICYPGSEIIYMSDVDMFNMPETKIPGITFEILK